MLRLLTGSLYKTHNISSTIHHSLTEALILTLNLSTLPWEVLCEYMDCITISILYILDYYLLLLFCWYWINHLIKTQMCGWCGEWDVIEDCVPLLSHSTGIVWVCERMRLPFHFDLVLQFHPFWLQWYRIKVRRIDFRWRNDRY